MLAEPDRQTVPTAAERFRYITDKVAAAELELDPFPHIEIHDVFDPDDFTSITSSPEIDIAALPSDEALLDSLFDHGYRIIKFPGCVTDREAYLEWHRDRLNHAPSPGLCEGTGMTLRLFEPQSSIVADVMAWMGGDEFRDTLIEKFGLGDLRLDYDVGIQKYLDGYEISPHPDVRRKALTFMLNINPAPDSEQIDHHTHYLRFKPTHQYVNTFWATNPDQDRCWVPWGWCDTVKQQRANNSLVIFAPSDDTLHAVKASYDHLAHQRTQLYGNLWRRHVRIAGSPTWADLAITDRPAPPVRDLSVRRLASTVKSRSKRFRQRGRAADEMVARRFFQS